MSCTKYCEDCGHYDEAVFSHRPCPKCGSHRWFFECDEDYSNRHEESEDVESDQDQEDASEEDL